MTKQRGGRINIENFNSVEGATTLQQAATNTVINQQKEAENQIEMKKQSGGGDKIEVNTVGNDDSGMQKNMAALTLKAEADAEFDKNAGVGGSRIRRKSLGRKSKRRKSKRRKSKRRKSLGRKSKRRKSRGRKSKRRKSRGRKSKRRK